MMRSSLLLLACLTLVMLAAGEADAKEPEWNHTNECDDMFSVAISADGEQIASGGLGCFYFFNKDSNTPVWSFEYNNTGPILWFYDLGISANGDYIAAIVRIGNGFTNYRVSLFDKNSSTPIWSYETEEGSFGDVTISADGEYIAVTRSGNEGDGGDGINAIYLFNKDNSIPIWIYETEDSPSDVAISADGEYIAFSAQYNTYIFNKDSGTPLWNYTTEVPTYKSLAISADGEYITVAERGDNGKVYLFNKDSDAPLWSYHIGEWRAEVAISADGEYITVAGSDDKLYLFGKDSNTPIWIYEHDGVTNSDSVAISADGEYIALSGYDALYLFGKDSNIPIWISETLLRKVAISADGMYIAGFDNDENIYLFLNDNIRPIATINSISPSPARFIAFNGSGSDSDGVVLAYEWFSDNDGFLSDEEDFSITGFNVGNHTISFRVQDNDGEWSEWDTAVLEISNTLPVGTLDSSNPTSVPKGTDGLLNGSGTDADGTAVDYRWTSSIDGQFSNNNNWANVIANEDASGVWTIQIISIDPQVSVNSVHWYLLDVQGNTKTDGLVSDVYGYYPGEGKAVIFIDNDFNGKLSPGDKFEIHPGEADSELASVSDVSDYSFRMKFEPTGELLWNDVWFGDNIMVGTPQVSTSALSFGSHIIIFQVQDNDGGWSEGVSQTLFVGAYPVASANHWNDDNAPRPNTPVQFRGSANDEDGSIALYEWDFNGDGEYDWSSTNNGSTSYSYVETGRYNAVLRITDDDGLTSTDTRTVYVSSLGIDPVSLVKDNLVYIALLFALIGGFVYWKNRDYPPSKTKPVTHTSSTSGTPLFSPSSMTNIECPSCGAQMEVPKLGMLQKVTCSECGISGEIEI